MRMSTGFLAVVLTTCTSLAADLGSPVPIPGSEARKASELGSRITEGGREETKTCQSCCPLTLRPALGVSRSEELQAQICPCGNNCECQAGQCPNCPVMTNSRPVATNYRQVWIRRMGWVWMQDVPITTSGGCSSGTCAYPGYSR
jgi:hypothetical protein